MKNFELNLDEKESIFLIDYSSYSSFFSRVNQPTLIARFRCTMIMKRNKTELGKKERSEVSNKEEEEENSAEFLSALKLRILFFATKSVC